MGEYLFVYGTLRFDLASVETRSLLAGVKRISAATVRGKLYDLGEYPGLILEEGGALISGEMLELGAAKTQLRALDAYEEFAENAVSQSLFVRTKCRAVLADGQSVEAWIYVYNQSLNAARLIEGGDYAEVAARPLQSEMANISGEIEKRNGSCCYRD
jgi:gamma-glutamylcyclotransferase (GGCT)/AIG2-like uncharacterized protein YtfP